MIPFFQLTTFSLGFVQLQVWGVCVALGIVLGALAVVMYGKREGVQTEASLDLCFWIIVCAFMGSRVWYAVVEWGQLDQWTEVFNPKTGGFSFSGGLVFGALCMYLYARFKHLSLSVLSGALAFGLPFGLMLGRVGCFLIFDHPGTPTDLFFGQVYTDGIVRHNHGLYLFIAAAVQACVYLIVYTRYPQLRTRWYVASCLIWLGVTRFVLDFFRAQDTIGADTRFFELTAAQYVSLILVVVGGIVWYAMRHETQDKKRHSL